jgi:hypothetical protein
LPLSRPEALPQRSRFCPGVPGPTGGAGAFAISDGGRQLRGGEDLVVGDLALLGVRLRCVLLTEGIQALVAPRGHQLTISIRKHRVVLEQAAVARARSVTVDAEIADIPVVNDHAGVGRLPWGESRSDGVGIGAFSHLHRPLRARGSGWFLPWQEVSGGTVVGHVSPFMYGLVAWSVR